MPLPPPPGPPPGAGAALPPPSGPPPGMGGPLPPPLGPPPGMPGAGACRSAKPCTERTAALKNSVITVLGQALHCCSFKRKCRLAL